MGESMRSSSQVRALVTTTLLMLSHGALAADDVVVDIDDATGIKHWRYEGGGLGIELVQVPPDFIRASYGARNLPDNLIESVATRCVFGTIIRNISDAPLSYRVADWTYRVGDGPEQPIKTKSEWLKEWHGMGVRFSWSMLADDVTFAVGDWIQGFTTLAEPHGSRIDLIVRWTIEGQEYEKQLRNLECAPAPADAA